MSSHEIKTGSRRSIAKIGSTGIVVLLTVLTAACDQQEPRSFEFFMEDAIARDGALARCNQDRAAAAGDIECENARRAAEAVAVAEQKTREAQLRQRSEQTLLAMRDRATQEQEAALRAEQEARAAAEAAYEAQWVDGQAVEDLPPAPEGIVAFDVYAQRDDRLAPSFDVVDAAPASDFFTLARPEIDFARPELEIADVTISRGALPETAAAQ